MKIKHLQELILKIKRRFTNVKLEINIYETLFLIPYNNLNNLFHINNKTISPQCKDNQANTVKSVYFNFISGDNKSDHDRYYSAGGYNS